MDIKNPITGAVTAASQDTHFEEAGASSQNWVLKLGGMLMWDASILTARVMPAFPPFFLQEEKFYSLEMIDSIGK